MITCNLMGGLGNQLFQIFTTIHYSLLAKNPFKFLNIKILGAGTTTIRYTYWDSFLIKLRPFLLPSFSSKLEIIKEKDYTYKDIQLSEIINKDICLFGYFQSYKYFEKNFEVICKLLNINDMKNIVKNKIGYDHEFYNETVSMHFRLGDYKNIQDYHPILPYEYYKNALQFIVCQITFQPIILYFYEKKDEIMIKACVDKLKKDFPKCFFLSINHQLPLTNKNENRS